MTSKCNTVTIERLAAQLAFNNATFAKCSSSMHFAKKPVREMSENMRLFGAVNGAGIVNGHGKFFLFLLVFLLISALHTPISSVWPVVSHHFFIALKKEHSLGTQTNGVLDSPIFLLHKMVPPLPPV